MNEHEQHVINPHAKRLDSEEQLDRMARIEQEMNAAQQEDVASDAAKVSRRNQPVEQHGQAAATRLTIGSYGELRWPDGTVYDDSGRSSS